MSSPELKREPRQSSPEIAEANFGLSPRTRTKSPEEQALLHQAAVSILEYLCGEESFAWGGDAPHLDFGSERAAVLDDPLIAERQVKEELLKDRAVGGRYEAYVEALRIVTPIIRIAWDEAQRRHD